MIDEIKNKPEVIIIDYHLGNLFSVVQACLKVGINARISSKIDDIYNADALILPGVGAFPEAMKNINKLGIYNPIREKVKSGHPILGICLGQQLLLSESEEFVNSKGLDLIPGLIKKFPREVNNHILTIPQIGWNRIYNNDISKWNGTPLENIENNSFMYFVHSFYTIPEDNDAICSLTNYDGFEYCSSLAKKNIFSTQFHPEKSAEKGLKIYKKWAEINKLI